METARTVTAPVSNRWGNLKTYLYAIVTEGVSNTDYFTFQINVNAQYFYEIVYLIEAEVKQPPSLSTSQKKKQAPKTKSSMLQQHVEKPVRLVSEASTQV